MSKLYALMVNGKTVKRFCYLEVAEEYARKHNIVSYKIYEIELPKEPNDETKPK